MFTARYELNLVKIIQDNYIPSLFKSSGYFTYHHV